MGTPGACHIASLNSCSDNSPPSAMGDGSSSSVGPNRDATTPILQGTMDKKDLDKQKTSYASLFRNNRLPNEKCLLKYIPLEGNELTLTFAEIDTVEDSLGFCLVGCMVGRKLNGYAVKEVIRQWGKNVKFNIHESGWITFFFACDDDRQVVLKGAPYLLFGRYLYLKEMTRCFLYRVEDMLSLPTWVLVHGLPADCWTNLALSRIASIVDKPIHTDKLTQSREKKDFARVFVEVDASKPKIHNFTINLPTGVKVPLHFVYETDPKFCVDCNTLGHSWDYCLRNKDRVVVDDNVEEDRGVDGQEGGVRDGARSRSRNDRRRWNRRHNRGGVVARGRGTRGGRGFNGGRGDGVEIGVDMDDGVLPPNLGVDEVGGGDTLGAGTIDPIVEEAGFVVTPSDGGDKFVVEVYVDECDDDGFEEVTSNHTKKAIRYLKRLEKECNSGSSNSNSTEFIELDPRSWLPKLNAKSILMTKSQAEARRLRAATRPL